MLSLCPRTIRDAAVRMPEWLTRWRPITVAGVVAAWVVLGLRAETFSRYQLGNPLLVVMADWIPALIWLAFGLLAWRRRPGVTIGPVMALVGLAWFLPTLGPNRWLVGISVVGTNGYLAMIAWLALAYPSGRIGRRYERIYLGVVLAWIGLEAVVDALLVDAGPSSGGVHSGLAVWNNPRLVARIQGWEQPVSAALAAGYVALLVVRFARTSPTGRRTLSGLWVGAAFLATFIVLDNTVFNGSEMVAGSYRTWAVLRAVSFGAIPVAFGLGVVKARASKGRIGRLVDELSAPVQGERLGAALARALGDPTAEVLYRAGSSGVLVDAHGRPRPMPADGCGRAATPVAHQGQELGVLIHDLSLREQPEVVQSVCSAAGLALANARLQAEVLAQLSEVQASRARIVQAGDRERRRIERNLHDGAQQRLTALRLSLRMAATHLNGNHPSLSVELDAAANELEIAIGELRDLARGIHPAILTDEGLRAALDSLIERTPIAVSLAGDLPGPLPPEIEAAAYYLIAEALANVIKHGRASHAKVALIERSGQLTVEVSDDGVGGADPSTGSGLLGLIDRVAAAGGDLSVDSPPGRGTRIVAVLPTRSAE
jgi:signal transduction histidine kinase